MAKRERETADMRAMVLRVVRSIEGRAGGGDIEVLTALESIQTATEQRMRFAVATLRAEPWNYSWADIGRELGITRQAAQQRFGSGAAGAEG